MASNLFLEAFTGEHKESIRLLPASKASIHIVLGSEVKPWLMWTLKKHANAKFHYGRIVAQHQTFLTKILSSSTAIWLLASIILPKAPDAELYKDSNPLIEALFNYQLIHIKASIIVIDMVSRNEVAFKLIPDSIESLIKYHRDIHCANLADAHIDRLEIKKLHEEFVEAINKFVYCTHESALEGLEEDGSGELLLGKSEEVKTNIFSLLQRAPPQKILPPPPQKILPKMVPGSSVEALSQAFLDSPQPSWPSFECGYNYGFLSG